VVLSSVFGRYADRRLTIAALDTVTEEEHVKRATALKERLGRPNSGVVWFDFVADLADGFDSTYAVASLLARKELTVDGHTLPRGQLLVMGGDEVYPKATRRAYTNQLHQPYAWAHPDHNRHSDEGIPVLPFRAITTGTMVLISPSPSSAARNLGISPAGVAAGVILQFS
jgi:hypothetical protein